MTSTLTNQRNFFRALDRASHPLLIKKYGTGTPAERQQLADLVMQMGNELRGRVLKRREVYAIFHTAPPSGSFTPSQITDEQVAVLSKIQLDVIRSHFPGTGLGQVDLAKFTGAFEQFASANLRIIGRNLPTLNCEPNSADLFCFAEFAFVIAEREHQLTDPGLANRLSQSDIDAWASFQACFVMIQDLFRRAYNPDNNTSGTSTKAYLYENYDQAFLYTPVPLTAAQITLVRNSYIPLPTPLTERAGLNAVNTFSLGSAIY